MLQFQLAKGMHSSDRSSADSLRWRGLIKGEAPKRQARLAQPANLSR